MDYADDNNTNDVNHNNPTTTFICMTSVSQTRPWCLICLH